MNLLAGLVDSSIRVSALLVIALGAMYLLRRRSAGLRHWILSTAVLCAAIVPALGAIVPAWNPVSVSLPSFVDVATASRAVPDGSVVARPGPEQSPTVLRTSAEFPAPVAPRASSQPTSARRILELLWIGGVLVGGALLFAGVARLTWVASRATPVLEGPWATHARDIAAAYRLRRPVRLLSSRYPSMLATWGVVRPQILLPAGAEDWPDDRIRAVLLHELAHIQRGDWPIQMLAGMLRTVYWFNPLTWITFTHVRQESEQACDDVVIAHGIGDAEYAAHLLAFARAFSHREAAWTPALLMTRPSTLRRRISRILAPGVNRSRATRVAIAVIAASCLAITLAIAAFRASSPSPSGSGAAVPAQPTTAERPNTDKAAELPPAPISDSSDAARAANASGAPVPAGPIAPSPDRIERGAPDPAAAAAREERRAAVEAAAAAVLELVESTRRDAAPDWLDMHPFLATGLDVLQRSARAVVDDDGESPAASAAKNNALLNALGNTANSAAAIGSRPRGAPPTRDRAQRLATTLQTMSDRLMAIVFPAAATDAAAATHAGDAEALRWQKAATTALDLAQSTMRDTTYVGPRLHTFLLTSLNILARAAEAVAHDHGQDQIATVAKRQALLSALVHTANTAADIGGRATETADAKGQSQHLATTLRSMAAPLGGSR